MIRKHAAIEVAKRPVRVPDARVCHHAKRIATGDCDRDEHRQLAIIVA
jgi:hypothetical protein